MSFPQNEGRLARAGPHALTMGGPRLHPSEAVEAHAHFTVLNPPPPTASLSVVGTLTRAAENEAAAGGGAVKPQLPNASSLGSEAQQTRRTLLLDAPCQTASPAALTEREELQNLHLFSRCGFATLLQQPPAASPTPLAAPAPVYNPSAHTHQHRGRAVVQLLADAREMQRGGAGGNRVTLAPGGVGGPRGVGKGTKSQHGPASALPGNAVDSQHHALFAGRTVLQPLKASSSSPLRVVAELHSSSPTPRSVSNAADDDDDGTSSSVRGGGGGDNLESMTTRLLARPQTLAGLEDHIRRALIHLNTHKYGKQHSLQAHKGGGGGTTSTSPQKASSPTPSSPVQQPHIFTRVDVLPINPPSEEELARYDWSPLWGMPATTSRKTKATKGQAHHEASDECDVFIHHEQDSTHHAADGPSKAGGIVGGIDATTSSTTLPEGITAMVKTLAVPTIRNHKHNANDCYRNDRIRVFSAAAKVFASQFKQYRTVLLWIMREFDDYATYCHEVVPLEFREQVEAMSEQKYRSFWDQERLALEQRLAEKDAENKEMRARVEALEDVTNNARHMIAERDRAIEKRNRELVDNAEARVAMLSRIERLEKELWHQKKLAEEPEKRTKELVRANLDLQDKVHHYAAALTDSEDACHRLRNRLERVEEDLRERRQNEQQTATKAQYQAWKKREVELLSANAKLQLSTARTKGQLEAALAQISRGRHGQLTPRPLWTLVDDNVFPEAASTGQRVRLGHERLHSLSDELNRAKAELFSLRAMYLPAALSLLESNHGVMTAHNELWMLTSKFIPKLGLDTRIPSYLKGVGRATNLRLSRDEVLGYCRLFWFEKDLARATVPMEQVVSRVFANHGPRGVDTADVAYSFMYGLLWYQFERHARFTRQIILGEIDEACITAIQDGAKTLRKLLTDHGQGSENDPSADVSNSPKRTAMGENNKEESNNKSPTGPSLLPAPKPQYIERTRAIALLQEYFTGYDERVVKRLVDSLNASHQQQQASPPQTHGATSTTPHQRKGESSSSPRPSAMLSSPRSPTTSTGGGGSYQNSGGGGAHGKSSLLHIASLFSMDTSSRKRAPFLDEVIALRLEEREELLRMYISALDAASALLPQSGALTPNNLARQLFLVDPAIPPPHMDDIMCDVFECAIEQLSPDFEEISAAAAETIAPAGSPRRESGNSFSIDGSWSTPGRGNDVTVLVSPRAPAPPEPKILSAGPTPRLNLQPDSGDPTTTARTGGGGGGTVGGKQRLRRVYLCEGDIATDYATAHAKLLRRPLYRFSFKQKW